MIEIKGQIIEMLRITKTLVEFRGKDMTPEIKCFAVKLRKLFDEILPELRARQGDVLENQRNHYRIQLQRIAKKVLNQAQRTTPQCLDDWKDINNYLIDWAATLDVEQAVLRQFERVKTEVFPTKHVRFYEPPGERMAG